MILTFDLTRFSYLADIHVQDAIRLRSSLPRPTLDLDKEDEVKLQTPQRDDGSDIEIAIRAPVN